MSYLNLLLSMDTKSYKVSFSNAVQTFFTTYLIRERGLSNNTIRSYRDTFVLLLTFFERNMHISADKLSLRDMTRTSLNAFLDWLESEQHCSVSTRNQRYAALRSFFKFMMYQDPANMETWKQICSIRAKKCESLSPSYLSVEALKSLLEQIETDTLSGRRNLAMISLLYNSGARVQELIDLTPRSLRLSGPCVIELMGKGSKKRIVPLDNAIVSLMERYMKDNHLDEPRNADKPLFSNSWGGKLTNPGVTYIINKYVAMARALHPDLYSGKITPHVFRHSRAMHLLQAGVNLVYIRDILGHVSIQTTEVYARADSKQKRMALEKAYESLGLTEPDIKSWERNPEIKEFLKSFC